MMGRVVRALLENLWNSIRFGETVIVEKTDSGDVYQGLYHLITWGLDSGYTVIVFDVFDSLYLERAKMHLAGFDDSVVDNVLVIKVGGSIETGKVVGKITDTSEPAILMRKFRDIYEPILEGVEGKALTITVGLEKLLGQFSEQRKAIVSIIHGFYRYIGNEKRIAFWLVKGKQLEALDPYSLGLLEDTSTTLIRTWRENGRVVFRVIKSVDSGLIGMEIKF